MIDMRVLIAGGGTGGHLYPGMAVAEEVLARPGGEVLFVGTARGLEVRVVPAAGLPLALIDVRGIKGTGAAGFARGLKRLPHAFLSCVRILHRFRPDVVVGVGGYASGPLVLAAAMTGYPTAILEQNSVPGVTNRILGRFVRAVFVAWDGARGFFRADKTSLLGNPVRKSFLGSAAAAAATAATASSKVAGDGGSPTVLVSGGSQGARAVNDLFADAAALLAARGALPRVVHQTGAADADRVLARYHHLGIAARVTVTPFIDDMAAAFRAADLVVGRAGALTLAELAVVGRPAVLIPFPHATDDHQTVNAAEMERAGAAAVLAQRDATPERLAALLGDLLAAPARRAAMAAAMTALGRPHAARQIVDRLEGLANR